MASITDVDDVVTQFTITHNNQDELLVTWTAINNSFSGRVCVQIEQLFPSTVVEYPESKGRMLHGQHQIHTTQGRSYKGRLQMFNKSADKRLRFFSLFYKSDDGPEVQTHEITKFFVPECAAQRMRGFGCVNKTKKIRVFMTLESVCKLSHSAKMMSLQSS
uniref:Fibronectin type-III domain-containing protein n=1 Tax=Globodera pallida TaxID=36090 RepID=A0A183BRE8_GLOPA